MLNWSFPLSVAMRAFVKEGSSSTETDQSDLAQFGCVERHRIRLKLNGFSCGLFGLAVSSACQLSSS
jgi:hypothetical protein